MSGKMTAFLSAVIFSTAVINTASASVSDALIFTFNETESIVLNSSSANGNESVEISVNADSTGVQSWVAELGYDPELFDFQSIDSEMFDGLAVSANNGVITINCYEFEDVTASGKAFTLTFTLKQGTKPQSTVFTFAPSDDSGNCFRYDDTPVPCAVVEDTLPVDIIESKNTYSTITASVTLADGGTASGVDLLVKDSSGTPVSGARTVSNTTLLGTLPDGEYTITASKNGFAPRVYTFSADGEDKMLEIALNRFGDLDGDGNIGMLDLALMQQFLAGWEAAPIYENTADLNSDGTINMLDLAMLQQYLAGWDITLG